MYLVIAVQKLTNIIESKWKTSDSVFEFGFYSYVKDFMEKMKYQLNGDEDGDRVIVHSSRLGGVRYKY